MRFLYSVLLLMCGFFIRPALAEFCDGKVSVAIVLLTDASQSIDTAEWETMRTGLVAAFRHPDVINAIMDSECGRIAVAEVQWSAPNMQKTSVPWRVLDSPASSMAFADELARQQKHFNDATSIASAIRYGRSMFVHLPWTPLRKVLDVAGDGPDDNDLVYGGMWEARTSSHLYQEREEAVRAHITINGLSINDHDGKVNIHAYYQNSVVSPDGFHIGILRYTDFATAIRRKLVIEIAMAE